MRLWAFLIGAILAALGLVVIIPGVFFTIGDLMIDGPIRGVLLLLAGSGLIIFSFRD